jgi:putative peptide modification system cyclase
VNAGANAELDPQSSTNSLLRTLVLCDLVESTALVERLGDREAAELIRKHDRLARTLADRHGGQEIDKTDGFLMMFDRPIQAVAFALDYQRGLRQLNAAENASLSARVGIHVGDVVVWGNSSEDIAKGAKPVEVEGLVKPITSRLMSLALPGQILLSNIAYDLAHRAQGELGEALDKVRWRTHGRYRFRGVPDPVAVFEVGEDGLAPLKAPPWSSKAHREVPFWRRPATVVIEALVVLALVALPLVMFLRPDPAIAFAKRDWVVVGSLNNLTSETVFDDALESALRIGLEQSRYVNVLPDLKVRDTVTRMQRDPNDTEIDRAVGSEVAIRDGARALILPTIAEIGGRVRITAEVVDPQTQTTVYSETADGIGKESILPSLDIINSRLRVRLGEALATVSNESRPLEKVATANLDALRSYSLALKAHDAGDVSQAKTLYEHAIELDRDFARARIELGTLNIEMDRIQDAKDQLNLAMQSGDRLSNTDKLLIEASLSTFSSPRESLIKWKALASLEPDLFPAQGAYAYYSWMYANDFPEAIEAVQRNTIAQNPNRGSGLYLLGTLYLGMERYPDAIDRFEEALGTGTRLQNNYYSAAYAAQRKFEELPALQREARAATTSIQRLSSQISRLTLMLDQGQWRQLQSALDASGEQTKLLAEIHVQPSRDAVLGVRYLVSSPTGRKGIIEKIESTDSNEYPEESSADDAGRLFRALLAVRSGNSNLSNVLLTKATDAARYGNNPSLLKMSLLVKAELDLQQGRHDDVIRDLVAGMDGTELYTSHVTLMNAYAKSGDFEAARSQANWLSSHRGRAYAEISGGSMFTPYNVGQSTLAILDAAEYSVKLGESAEARRLLQELRGFWPNVDMPAWLAERIDKVAQASERQEAPQSGL